MKSIKILSLVSSFTICLMGFNACTKKEQPQPPPSSNQMIPAHTDIQMPSSEQTKIVIPPEIKGKWKGIVLTITDKQTMNGRDYKIPIGDKFSISGSHLEVQTGVFLPDLQIMDNVYSTASAELNNPAIQVEVREGGKEIFKGWLFQKFPTVHPFKHDQFTITLKEPVSAL